MERLILGGAWGKPAGKLTGREGAGDDVLDKGGRDKGSDFRSREVPGMGLFPSSKLGSLTGMGNPLTAGAVPAKENV